MEQATNIVDGFEEGTFDDAITMYRDAYDLFEGALLFGGKYKQFIQKSIDEAQNYIDHLEELLEERADRRQVQPQRRQVQQQRQVPQRRHEVLELALAERKSNRRDSDDDPDELSDGLPDELKRFGKDLVEKIENEIMESGDAVSFDEIAGLVDQKQTVQEVVCWPLKRPELFTGLRTMPNGLLLFGPPGTGKTMLGTCAATLLCLPQTQSCKHSDASLTYYIRLFAIVICIR
jgi:SpoVK/Ycf46/Vps4 family AAA+-type ATPase